MCGPLRIDEHIIIHHHEVVAHQRRAKVHIVIGLTTQLLIDLDLRVVTAQFNLPRSLVDLVEYLHEA